MDYERLLTLGLAFSVPQNYLRGGLGEWVDELKGKGRDGLLEPEEANQLLRVGFTWMENRDSWHENFDETTREVSRCRKYDKWGLSGETENWLKVQFMLLEYDLLPLKRKERLDSLGLDWDGKVISWSDRNTLGDRSMTNLYDDEISTGFDLKGAAMLWTPDEKGTKATKTHDRPKGRKLETTETGMEETEKVKDAAESTNHNEPAENQSGGSVSSTATAQVEKGPTIAEEIGPEVSTVQNISSGKSSDAVGSTKTDAQGTPKEEKKTNKTETESAEEGEANDPRDVPMKEQTDSKRTADPVEDNVVEPQKKKAKVDAETIAGGVVS